MPVHPSAIALITAFLILVCISAQAHAETELVGSFKEVTVPLEFPISGSVQTVCTGVEELSLTGNVQIIQTGQTSYLFIPAQVENGAKLISLNDPEQDVVFRNNTIVLPVYENSSWVAGLVLATEGLTANNKGFFGRVTGAELDIPEAAITIGGFSFSADIAIFLKDLSQTTTYQVRTDSGIGASEVIDTRLSQTGLSTLDVPLVLEIEGSDRKSSDTIDFLIVSLKVDAGWVQKYSGQNITLFDITNETASPLPSRGLKSGNDTIVYQAILPGSSKIALAATGSKTDRGLVVSTSNILDVGLYGGLLLMLIFLLGIVIKRVVKR